jgi:hypothetical protein
MSQNQISAREQIANAACDVAGRPRPLGSGVAKNDRVFLYGCPKDEGSQFVSDDLSERLSATNIPHGVDWDPKSKTFGVRFVSRAVKIPPEIKPFSSPEALKAWKSWKDRQVEMAQVVSDAARSSKRGDRIDFMSEDEILQDPKSRRRLRSQGERD